MRQPYLYLRCVCGHEATLHRGRFVDPPELLRMKCMRCRRVGKPKVVAQGMTIDVNAMDGCGTVGRREA